MLSVTNINQYKAGKAENKATNQNTNPEQATSIIYLSELSEHDQFNAKYDSLLLWDNRDLKLFDFNEALTDHNFEIIKYCQLSHKVNEVFIIASNSPEHQDITLALMAAYNKYDLKPLKVSITIEYLTTTGYQHNSITIDALHYNQINTHADCIACGYLADGDPLPFHPKGYICTPCENKGINHENFNSIYYR